MSNFGMTGIMGVWQPPCRNNINKLDETQLDRSYMFILSVVCSTNSSYYDPSESVFVPELVDKFIVKRRIVDPLVFPLV